MRSIKESNIIDQSNPPAVIKQFKLTTDSIREYLDHISLIEPDKNHVIREQLYTQLDLLNNKLEMIKEDHNTVSSGTYVAINYNEESNKILEEFCEYLGVNKSEDHDFHSTIIYSRKVLEKLESLGDINWIVSVTDYDVWNGEHGDAFVLVCNCQEATDRHNQIVKEHGATHDYDNFILHITIGYDVDTPKLPSRKDITGYIRNIKNLTAINEYTEELND